MPSEAVFPPADFVRRGPPVSVRDLERKKREKWSRVVVVSPRPQETSERVRYDFVSKGPYTLPLAVLRDDVDAGDKFAWQFFTHPYSVFPEDSCFYNVPGKGCLGARLFVRAPEGLRLYDEVGANLEGSEFVANDFPGALGVLRDRVLGGAPESSLASPYLLDLLELDVDLLELFYLTTFLLRTSAPSKSLAQLHALISRPTLSGFVRELYSEDERELLRQARGGELSDDAPEVAAFRVREEDFLQVSDVRDGQRRQVVARLMKEYEAFEAEHKDQLTELSRKIQAHDVTLSEIKADVRRLKDEQKEDKVKRGISGLWKRAALFGKSKTEQINELKAEAVKSLRAKRALEQEIEEIPGYAQVRGLTERMQGFQDSVATIHGMASNIVDHNVARSQLNGLRTLVREKVASLDSDEARKGLRTYSLRLRAEILPRVLAAYEISAYVLRRPDAIRPGSQSQLQVKRINTLAKSLIEYFRYMPYGNKDLGEAFDSGWGQVLQLEAQL